MRRNVFTSLVASEAVLQIPPIISYSHEARCIVRQAVSDHEVSYIEVHAQITPSAGVHLVFETSTQSDSSNPEFEVECSGM